MILKIVLIIQSPFLSSITTYLTNWGYSRYNNNWSDLKNTDCDGKYQSPIDLIDVCSGDHNKSHGQICSYDRQCDDERQACTFMVCSCGSGYWFKDSLKSVFDMDMIASLIAIVNPVKSVPSLDPVCTTMAHWQESLPQVLSAACFYIL